MKSVFIVLLSSMLFHVISARPDGAPKGACDSMTPSKADHGGADPKEANTSPYKVTVNKSYYKAGEPVNVNIEGSMSNMIMGILVQARQKGSSIPIGTFSNNLSPGVRHLECTKTNVSLTDVYIHG